MKNFNKLKARTIDFYYKFTNLKEIEQSSMLKWLIGAVLLSFFVSFFLWTGEDVMSISAFINGSYTCPPYFQSCGQYYFFTALPYGYSQNAWYVILLAIIGGAVVAMKQRKWLWVHICLSVLLLWKILVVFFLSYGGSRGNYDYYDMLLALIILFFPSKVFFTRAAFVTLYVMAGILKLHEGWIYGTYLTTLTTGIPVFGNHFAPIITGLVVVMQLGLSWLLLTNKDSWGRMSVFLYFAAFHFYSGLLVGYRYLTISIPALFILFWLFRKEEKTIAPSFKKGAAGYILLALLMVLQLIPVFRVGDERLSLEGNYYRLYMFEANHQCDSYATVYRKDGTSEDMESYSRSAHSRCDPYKSFFRLQTVCQRDETIDRIAWQFDHSINGKDFLRIVDIPNVCELDYKPFTHNDWIKTDKDNPEVIKPASKNYY